MKKHGKLIYFMVSIITLLSACSNLPYKDGMKMEEKTLDNGLKVIIRESHSAPVIAFNMWVKTGSRNEDEKTLGLSHMLEHMLFKGTEKRKVGEIAKEIDSAGGTINAFTSKDVTVYYLTIASRFFSSGLDIISDTIMNSSLDSSELEKEKKVILEEIRMGDDEPERSTYDDLFMTAYSKHTYRNPVIGYQKTVESVSRETLMGYYKKWYVPENMTLIVVGDIDSNKAMAEIEKAFNNFNPNPLPATESFSEPEQENMRFKLLRKDVKQAQVKIGFHIPGVKSSDVPDIDLLASILGDGDSSRLYKKLKLENQIVNSVYSYSMTPQDPGLFLVSLSAEPDKVEEALNIVFSEIKNLVAQNATGEEMSRAKLSIESSTIYTLETVDGMAQNLGNYVTLTGDVNFEEKYLEKIRRSLPEDIRKAAEKYLTLNNMSLIMLLPTDSKIDFNEEKIKALYNNAHKSTVQETSAVTINHEEKTDIKGRHLTENVLSNGTVLIIEEDHEVPVVAIQATFAGGTNVEKTGDEGIMNFTFEMLPMGAGGKSSIQIAEEVDNIAGNLSDFSGRDLSGISLNFLSKYLDNGVDIFFNVLEHPDFPGDSIEKKRTEILSHIKNKEDNLTRYVFTLFSKSLFGDNPYGHDILGTKETVEKFSREGLINYYNETVKADNLIISVVGDVKSEDIVKIMEQRLSSWKTGKTEKIEKVVSFPRLSEIKKSIINKNREQAHIILGFYGPSVLEDDAYDMEVLDSILAGQGGRLFIELRDKQSLAYSVTSFFRPYRYSGVFGVYIATKPDNREKAVSGILEELKRVLSGDITEEEIERSKKALIGNFEIGLQKRKARASVSGSDEALGLGYDNYTRYAGKILAVTKDDIIKTAKKYIDPEHYVITILEPEKTENNNQTTK
ncbi:MAG: insulinase family protein [Candidatus Schekmanbacteria bacterium]|nr:insulinase family protein [Candidatus Schekmanbacteria bacterium]